MNIGSVRIDTGAILAPLAGISDLPFRTLARKAGAGLVCSEMISAEGLIRQSRITARMLSSNLFEKPLSVQLFGSKPDVMAEAARHVEASGADILDINMGCSVRKVIKTGAGVALMKDPVRCETILRAIRKAVQIPLTIKIRSGWEGSGRKALAVSAIAQDCGVDAICVHPRTARQGFSGNADWSIIHRVKQAVSIPVIGNGDIVSASGAMAMLEQTGCDAVMIGRAAIGNPWIFSRISALLVGKPEPSISISDHFNMVREFIEASVNALGEPQACRVMRSRLGWFVKYFPGSTRFREAIKRLESKQEALEKISAFQEALEHNLQLRVFPSPDTPVQQNFRIG
jgi:nifR3 family TIM-barrel protein